MLAVSSCSVHIYTTSERRQCGDKAPPMILGLLLLPTSCYYTHSLLINKSIITFVPTMNYIEIKRYWHQQIVDVVAACCLISRVRASRTTLSLTYLLPGCDILARDITIWKEIKREREWESSGTSRRRLWDHDLDPLMLPMPPMPPPPLYIHQWAESLRSAQSLLAAASCE